MTSHLSTKTCYSCHEDKPLTEYHRDSRLSHGTKHICKKCNSARATKHWKDHPERRAEIQKQDTIKHRSARYASKSEYKKTHKEAQRAHSRKYLLKRYGLTTSDFAQKLVSQGSCCAMCGISFEGRKACVDHCHATGKVRDLLCSGCNLRLGVVEDVQFRTIALAYLAKHS